ncbi:hypothetical protein KKE06_05550 [Candidatus Micrarchaeota archaeon]|nr:hypothetical protein [Candidatus Micrarchaeota archaeon]MBU1930592.1 hypothetical protein [Candidatus Micrarchaeota archaeon]
MQAKILAILSIIGIIVLVGIVFWAENAQIYLWNSLRPLEQVSEGLNIISTVVVLLLSLGLFAISLKAYGKNNSNRFLLLSLAFGIMFAKFLIKLLDFFYSPGYFFSQAAQNVFDFFVLIALFSSLINKG